MKKVFWGVLLAMANLPSILLLVGMMFIRAQVSPVVAVGMGLAAGLLTALGYFLIMQGSQELPQTQNWHYAGSFSKILCAYQVAISVFHLLPLNLPSVVSTILSYITDFSSFLVMYFCVLGLRDLQYVSRTDLGAESVNKCFSAWVLLNLLSSLISGYIQFAAIAIYILMLVLYGRAARRYEKRNITNF